MISGITIIFGRGYEYYSKKSLGQYWLNDQPTLKRIVELAQINNNDTVLEIGPGLGSLTEQIYPLAKETIAVEIDSHLAGLLSAKFKSSKVEVINQDILSFDLNHSSYGL